MKKDLYIEGFIGDIGGFFGDTKSFSLSDLNRFLDSLPSEVIELDVRINSGGGLITEGFAIYDKLVSSGLIVNTIVEGMAGSIATVIAQAGKSGSRKMFQNAEYFIHNPSWQPSSPENFEASDLVKLAEELKDNEEKIAKFYADMTGGSIREIKTRMSEATTLTAKEAKKLGFIDEVIETNITAYTKYQLVALTHKPKEKKMEAKLAEEIRTGFQNITDLFKKFTNNAATVFTHTLEDGSVVFSSDEKLTETSKLFKDSALTVEVEKKVAPVTDEEKETLKARVAELEAKLTEVETAKGEASKEVEAAKAAAADASAKVEEITKEFTNLKEKLVTGGFKNFVTDGVTKNQTVPTAVDADLDRLRKALNK